MGRLIAQFIVCGFAALWAWYGVSSLHGPAWLAPLALAPSVLIPALALSRPRADGEDWKQAQRPFYIVVALEGIAIFALVNLAANLHRPDLIMPAIALVVGLHFLPLARIFRFPAYALTGLALCALAIGSAFIVGAERAIVLGLGAAVTLWLTTAFATLGKPAPAHA
jgi:hypothetical protein